MRKRQYKLPAAGLVVCVILLLAAWPVASGDKQDAREHQSASKDAAVGYVVPFAGIQVLPYALGDVVPDSVVTIRDILRIRDIAVGYGPSATPLESNEGDLNLDGSMSELDVESVRDALLGRQGLPHILDAVGGSVEGAGVTLTFDANSLDSTLVMSIKQVTLSDLPGYADLFETLGQDSVYFMTGFELLFKRGGEEHILLDPSISIQLETAPPCNLQGDNLIMRPGIGSDGEPVLVPAVRLSVSDEEPPALAAGAMSAQGGTAILRPLEWFPPRPEIRPVDVNAIPGGVVQYDGKNVSKFSASIAFELTYADGSKLLVNPAWVDRGDPANPWRRLAIPVGAGPPGTVTVKIRVGSGNGWISGPGFSLSELLPLPPNENAQEIVSEFFSVADSFLAEVTTYVETVGLPASSHAAGIDQSTILAIAGMRDALFTLSIALSISDPLLVNAFAASVLANGYITKLGDARDLVRGPNVPGLMSIDGEWDRVKEGLKLGFKVIKGIISIPALVEKGGLKAVRDYLKIVRDAIAYGDWLGEYWYDSGDPVWYPDPESLPKKYPGLCINIFRHETNAEGLVASLPAQFAGALGNSNVDLSKTRRLPADANTVDFLVAPHPRFGAMVLPNSDGIQGVAGFVNEGGVFSIPGIRHGRTMSFRMFDPNTRLLDPDVGTGVSPNIAEQSFYFPVYVSFDADSAMVRKPLQLRNTAVDRLTSSSQQIEYVIYVGPSETHRTFNLGLCADYLVRFRVVDPSGDVVFDQDGVQNAYAIVNPLEAGPITATIEFHDAFAPTIEFLLGTDDSPYYPLRWISCNPRGALNPSVTYLVRNCATILSAQSLAAESGQTIEFGHGECIVSNGRFEGHASEMNPIVLRPAVGASVAARGRSSDP